jgi:hypothetical protein
LNEGSKGGRLLKEGRKVIEGRREGRLLKERRKEGY